MNPIRLLDHLEATTEGALVLDEAQRQVGQDLAPLVADGILLVDYRQRLDANGAIQPVTLCRLNRHHPSVKQAVGWD